MTKLYIDGTSAPPEVKATLHQLSKNIEFIKEDVKANNGFVFFGKNRITGVEVAVKFYYWGGKTEYHAEPQQLAVINSPNVLQIHDAGLIDNKWAYFQTPTCINGDLDTLLEETLIGNHAAIGYTCEILSGLSHLHAGRYLHRDLKPSNIYITSKNSAVIGDFGSVKRMPDAKNSIPASGHSVLYRPPESICHNSYGISGDIYQVGVTLFQLLGGYLPYDGRAWLSRRELAHYETLPSLREQDEFVDQCIRLRIANGKLIDVNTLPRWVPDSVKKVIKRACHLDDAKRFSTASAFLAKLHEIKPAILDWRIDNGLPILIGKPSYRIVDTDDQLRVQKQNRAGWRHDNSFTSDTVDELVQEIIVRLQ